MKLISVTKRHAPIGSPFPLAYFTISRDTAYHVALSQLPFLQYRENFQAMQLFQLLKLSFKTMKANHCFMLLGLCAVVADVNGHGQKCSSRTVRDGIPMPSRRAMLSLNTFKQKVR